MSIQQRSARSVLRMFFSVFCPLAVAFAAVNSGFAQEDSNADPVDQNKLVRAIYDATKTVKTTKDLTAFLAQCESALEAELSAENRKYVVSLTGWGLNRRGERHYEMATQLKRIGNQQYQSAMDKAMQDFDAAIVAAPERYRSWMSRGIAWVANEDYEKALADFTSVIKLKPDAANGWFNRAEVLYQTEKYDYAVEDYNVAIRLNSEDAQAITGRGLSLLSLGKFPMALADFESVIKSQPQSGEALVNRGDLYQKMGRWQESADDYRAANEITESAVACQRLAWVLATCPEKEMRDFDGALTLATKAVGLGGDTAINLDTLAACEAAKGNFNAAKATQQKVIGLVGAEEETTAEPFQARLMLYEKSEPYLQTENLESKSVEDDESKSRDSNIK